MALLTISGVKQAVIAQLRTNSPLVAGLTGGMHEGVALTGKKPPFLTYQVAYAPRFFDSTNAMAIVGFDILITSADPVAAQNLDQLVVNSLHDAALSVTGQTTLFCRRIADLSAGEVDEAGHKLYQVGGTFEVWVDQPR